jgi:hypothetical protein
MSDFIMYNINREGVIEQLRIIHARIKLIPPLKRTEYQTSVLKMTAPTKINALENVHLSHGQIYEKRRHVAEQVVPTPVIERHNIDKKNLNQNEDICLEINVQGNVYL